MRQVVLDTETTGFSPQAGHRIVELACVEVVGGVVTGRHFHRHFNPDRAVDPKAQEVHGLTADFLADKPRFAEVVDELVAFIGGAEIIAHNAPFDVRFLDHELTLAGRPTVDGLCVGVVDTVKLAREKHPGVRNDLSALCDRYQVDASGRAEHHGALVDALCLADVYLRMAGPQSAALAEG